MAIKKKRTALKYAVRFANPESSKENQMQEKEGTYSS
jgi:hypothetical protein